MKPYRPSSYRPRRRPARGTDAQRSERGRKFRLWEGNDLMSTAVITPVNPMSAEGKDTVMSVMRRDRAKFFELVEDPKNWNVQTRCTEWEVRDLVGHMIDVTEGYLRRWEAAKKGEAPGTLGLQVMGETLNDHARDFRKLSRAEAVERLKKDAKKVDEIFAALTPEEWT